MQAVLIYIIAVGFFALVALAYAIHRRFARRTASLLVLLAAAAVVLGLMISPGDPFVARSPSNAVPVWQQTAAIIGLLVASVLGVLARAWTARRALTDTDDLDGVAAGANRRDSLVMSMIVSVLLSTSLFGPWIDTILSAGAVWPMLLPFVAAFEKGFLWPNFFERFASSPRSGAQV